MCWVDFWDMLDGVLWGVLLRAGKAPLPEKRAMTKEEIADEREKLRELCKAKM
jgi:hypothetical protein